MMSFDVKEVDNMLFPLGPQTLVNSYSNIMEMGDCPNVEFPTGGGPVFWETLEQKNGLRLQYNYITRHSRILNSNNTRKAWGHPLVMKEKFRRLTRNEFLEAGDVIGVARKSALNIYEHYAVYIGNEEVVHYAAQGSDFSGEIAIRKASIYDFLKNDSNYFVLYFDDRCCKPHKIYKSTSFEHSDISVVDNFERFFSQEYKLYSPEETVQRALSRVGESKYNLVFNNCEHFAVWCKTGVSKSYQVNSIVENAII